MHLGKVTIKNFRQLQFIEEEFCDGINVIVGRNGAGKSNILEAIRLAKAMLAPRTQSESSQSLISLNAMSPHNQHLLLFDSIAGNLKADVTIICEYKLSPEEMKLIKANFEPLAVDKARSQLVNLSPANLASYFSSPEGKEALKEAKESVALEFDRVKKNGSKCRLSLTIQFQSGLITSQFPMENHFLAFLDRSMSFDTTKFTYFPADRALPRGEQPIQIGQQDAGQNLESHNSQPHLKYGRLKNMIFNAVIASPEGRDSIKKDFKLIFDNILPGRELEGVGLNQVGTLSIKIMDFKANRSFDIDQMSSGEKSLILTFLIMSRGISKDGLVLLDEPELHLHPAVCKELIPFLYENYAREKNIQMIICSHSPEILSGAFARDGCELFHLIDGTSISLIEPSNKPMVEEALLMLGTSESEGLLYKAIISVEGRDDVEVLESGFPDTFQAYKIKPQGSKSEVLTAIKKLKGLEKTNDLNSVHFFIFDRDHKPAGEGSTAKVKILEWDRHCLENYLIDSRIVANILKDKSISSSAPKNSAEVKTKLRSLALKQIDALALVKAYQELGIPTSTFELIQMDGLDCEGAWAQIETRIGEINGYFYNNSHDSIKVDVSARFERLRGEISDLWQNEWQNYCDGKKLFQDCYSEFKLVVSPLKLKRRIVSEMRVDPNNSNWKQWKGQIESFLQMSE